MKAIVHDKYGSFDLLGVRDIDKPVVKNDDVLVRVQAAGLHVGDCFGVRGAPFAMRLVTGLIRPKRGVPGFDVAGQVEAVGASVKRFRPGDDVFGACHGACAEYACVGQDTLALKPATLTFAEAAAVPTSALAALHALRDVGKVQAGQKVLIKSRAAARSKYEAAALATRARALWAQERRRDATRDARSACAIARQVGDPALLVRTLASLLPIVDEETVLQEARSAAGQVRAALPSGARQAFEGSELVRTLLR